MMPRWARAKRTALVMPILRSGSVPSRANRMTSYKARYPRVRFRPFVGQRGYNPPSGAREVSSMSDKEMNRLPERSVSGVNRKTQIRTLVSGLVADARGLVQRLRERRRKR